MDFIYNCATETAGIDWPSWIQAVGSVAGIFAAVGVAWWQQRVARREIAARDLADKTARYVRANRVLERFLATIGDTISDAEKIKNLGGDVPFKMQSIPQEVRDLENELHRIPEAGGDAFTAINAFEDARRFIKNGKIPALEMEGFVARLKEAESRCDKAGMGVRSFLFTLST